MRLIFALILTIITEGLVMLALTRSRQWVFCNLLCNCVTNPALNITLNIVVYPLFGTLRSYYIAAVIGELLVFAGEALLYRAMTGEKVKKCIVRSGITNLVSLALGLFLFSRLG